MHIIKRNGEEQEFNKNKIVAAISKANQTVEYKQALTLWSRLMPLPILFKVHAQHWIGRFQWKRFRIWLRPRL